MKRWEPLRGHGVIDGVFRQGRRLDAEMVRCVYQFVRHAQPGARVTFTAPSKVFNAVRRNRLKRLMREAFAKEWQSLGRDLERAGVSASLLFVFKGRGGARSIHPTLQVVQQSITQLCTTLRTQL